MSKRLIVNADDFGLTSSVTRGIVEGYRRGIVTSASLMASGEAFEEACELAQENPGLDLGVHLTLDEEGTVLSRNHIPSLLGPDGRFHSRTKVIQFLLTGHLNLVEVEREWSAQIERCLKKTSAISHLDSHGHIHTFPSLAELAEKLRAAYAIPFLRKPCEHLAIAGHRAGWRGYLKKTLVSCSATSALRKAGVSKQHTVTNFLGLAPSGRLDEETFWCLMHYVEEGTSELMTHPGYADERTRVRYGHWHYLWEEELSVLLSVAKAPGRLGNLHITLTTFAKEYSAGV